MKRTWENYTRIYMYSENQSNYLKTVRESDAITVHLVCLGNICRSPLANALLSNKCADLTKPNEIGLTKTYCDSNFFNH